MTIKTFEDWITETYAPWEMDQYIDEREKPAYNAGVKSASVHFEEEKIKIHEYYADKLAELFEQDIYKGTEVNGGKLT